MTEPRKADGLICPYCGEGLYEDRGLVWCSRVSGGGRGFSCDYGVLSEVTLTEHNRRLSDPPPSGAGKLTQPDGTGFWVFDGFRHSTAGKSVTLMRDLVEVRRVNVGRKFVLEVLMMGRVSRFAADTYEGTWVRVSVNFGGKRI